MISLGSFYSNILAFNLRLLAHLVRIERANSQQLKALG